jgi:beta-lactamase regulating signal transducer with metallopeptidase domain/biopolymer transport protein ExbD
MMDFLIYDAKVAVALLVFYLFYRFLLKKETFHRLNRVVLVGTAVLSFLLPLCIITIHKPIEMDPVAPEPVVLAADVPAPESAPFVEPNLPWWPVVLTILFWVGVTFVLARVLISILSIIRIIRQGEPVREEDGCRILVTERCIDPFSWMKYIILSKKDWEQPHASILTHEKAHIAYGHSIEVLLVDVLSALQWFNPAIWMLRADLKEIHEYEADDAVLRTGANLREYQYLLIRKAVSKSGYSVANSFNHSILKNRITMMSKSRSPLARGLRALYLLPLVCLAIGLQARTVYVPMDKDSEKNVSDEKPRGYLSEIVVIGYGGQEAPRHHKSLEKDPLPSIKNPDMDTEAVCSENFSWWLNTRIFYPDEAKTDDGTILAKFTVGTDGKVKDIEILWNVSEQLDGIVARQIAKSPDWTPAMKNGKPVEMTFIQPVIFKVRASSKTHSPTVLNIRKDGTIESGGKVYTVSQLKDIIPPHAAGQPQTTVTIMAADDVLMGAIDDVKNELRKLESLKIFYASASSREGVTRYMPPIPNNGKVEVAKNLDEMFRGVDRETILMIRINSAGAIMLGNRRVQDDAEIVRLGKAFLKEHGKETHFGLRHDRGTSYGAYTRIQTLLTQVYEEVRDEKAMEVYGKRLQDLSADERSQINLLVPLSISEAETKG